MPDKQFGPECQDYIDRRVNSAIEREIANGIVSGFKILLDNKELTSKFWELGFEELSKHTKDSTNQWIGKRILTWIISSVTIAGLVWLVKSGIIK